MANQCSFCGIRHVETSMMVLNEGNMWVEFCSYCGENNVLHNELTNETLLVRELYDSCIIEAEGYEFVRAAADVYNAAEVARRCQKAALEDAIYNAESERLWELLDAERAQQPILNAEHWDNLIYRCLHSTKWTAPNYLCD
jgi:hypothetical protein